MRYLSMFSYSHARDYLLKIGFESLVRINEKYFPEPIARKMNIFAALVANTVFNVFWILVGVIVFKTLFSYGQPFFESWGWEIMITQGGLKREFIADEQWIDSLVMLLLIFMWLFWVRQNRQDRAFKQLQQEVRAIMQESERKRDRLEQRLDNSHIGVLGRQPIPETSEQKPD